MLDGKERILLKTYSRRVFYYESCTKLDGKERILLKTYSLRVFYHESCTVLDEKERMLLEVYRFRVFQLIIFRLVQINHEGSGVSAG